MSRLLCWFSCGDASAVACAIALNTNGADGPALNAVVARIVIDNEHSDNHRFAADCSRWYGLPITELRSAEYKDCWAVWEKRKYFSGIKGAPCTTELKKVVRFEFQRADDVHVWGYTKGEEARAYRFRDSNPEIFSRFPLIDAGLSKADCHAMVRARGIQWPAMYELGFHNNNCIGCAKAQGAGYWNLTREHFPEVFARTAELTRRIGAKPVKYKGERIHLDELPKGVGSMKKIEVSCSPFCEQTELAP